MIIKKHKNILNRKVFLNGLFSMLFIFSIIINIFSPSLEIIAQEIEPIKDHGYRNAMISAGLYHNVMVNEKGEVFAWGDNAYGQLGIGTFERSESPARIEGIADVVMVSAGAYHSLALTSDGSVYSWGRNTFGQIGNGSTQAIPYPTRVGQLPPIKEISAGSYHSLALTIDGLVFGWGNNTKGQLGNISSEEIIDDAQSVVGYRVRMPQHIDEIENAIAISAGGNHSLYINSQKLLFSWGDNEYGQLGYPTEQLSSSTPAMIENFSNVKIISAGYLHNIAVLDSSDLESDAVYTWGSNTAGQLGIGDLPADENFIYVPKSVNFTDPIMAEGIEVSKISAGYLNSIITTKDNNEPGRDNIFIWGNNDYGQLGIGKLPSQNLPVKMVATSNGWTSDSFLPFQSVSAGGYHTMFLSVKGFLGAAGRADRGQLGTVSILNSYIPIGVPIIDAISPMWKFDVKPDVTIGTSSIAISFEPAVDNIKVTGYEVRYLNENQEPITAQIKETHYRITDIDLNSIQTISIFALDAQENISYTPLIYHLNVEDPQIERPVTTRNRTSFSPELYGEINPLEVPWDVDYIYGVGTVVPPKDYSFIIAIVITAFVLLFFFTIGVLAFKRNHKDIKIFGDIIRFKSKEEKLEKKEKEKNGTNSNLDKDEEDKNKEINDLEIHQIEIKEEKENEDKLKGAIDKIKSKLKKEKKK